MLLDVVARYKEALSIPCGTVTYMDPAHAPAFFEQALKDGKVDFYLMNRPLTVDNEYVKKLRENRADEIAPCTRCLHCHIGSNELNAMMGYCRVNALTQRVMRKDGPATYELPELATKKRVGVIGGGPAGMEAARIAALRGHDVVLFEKAGALGGRLSFASAVKGPHENLDDLQKYLSHQVELAGVDVRTGTEATADVISAEGFDALVVATGGTPSSATAPDNASTVEFNAFMNGDLGDNVVIYGSNAQAFDAALWCTVHKHHVTIVTPHKNEELDMQQSQHAMRFMTSALYALGVQVYTESEMTGYSDGKLSINTGYGVVQSIPCDSLIMGAEWEPATETFESVGVSEVHVIGDAKQPYNIALAIRGGNDVGRSL